QRGWEQIHHDCWRIADMSGRDPTWPTCNQGHPETAFPVITLHASQSAGAASVPRAVVAREDDQGLLVDAELLQLVENLPDAPIKFQQSVSVQPGAALLVKVLRNRERFVRHCLRKVEEERFVFAAFNE